MNLNIIHLVSLHLTRSSLFSEMCSLYFISSELLLRPSCCFKWLSSPIAQLIFSLERLQWFIDCYAGCEIFADFPANNKCFFFQVNERHIYKYIYSTKTYNNWMNNVKCWTRMFSKYGKRFLNWTVIFRRHLQ